MKSIQTTIATSSGLTSNFNRAGVYFQGYHLSSMMCHVLSFIVRHRSVVWCQCFYFADHPGIVALPTDAACLPKQMCLKAAFVLNLKKFLSMCGSLFAHNTPPPDTYVHSNGVKHPKLPFLLYLTTSIGLTIEQWGCSDSKGSQKPLVTAYQLFFGNLTNCKFVKEISR